MLLARNAIGIDINNNALEIAKRNLDFKFEKQCGCYLKRGDAADLSFMKDNSIDMICTHPPYADIIKYSQDIVEDMSLLSVDEFMIRMNNVAMEAYRIIKPGKVCAFMMGDIRRKGNVIPLGFMTMNCFRNAGFTLKEIIIKEQHNCRGTKYWTGKKRSFLLLAHEYIFVMTK